jgi:hypothetical protein
MARNPEIEKILEAWWEWDHCVPANRAESKQRLDGLLNVIVAKGQNQHTREQILDYLWPQYRDFRLQRKRQEQVGVVQSALGSTQTS